MNLFSIESNEMYTESPVQSMFPAHTHDVHEIFCFLSGDATYSVEGSNYPLSPGDVVIMRAAETHHLILNKAIPYHRISIYFKPHIEDESSLQHIFLDAFLDRPIGLCNYYPATRYSNSNWIYFLKKICQAEDHLRKQTYLMVFLQELSDCYISLQKEPILTSSTPLLQITHYIDRHLTDTLNLDIICNRFFISKSQLIRIFKKNLGITVGEYINTKRLSLAQKRISSGEAPTSVYSKCGFNDYSTFFRAYKKKYGYGPATSHTNDFPLLSPF